MLELIEKKLKEIKEAINCENTPKKYRDQAAKDYIKLSKELDKIYARYSKLRRYEEKVCKQFDIETF